MLTIRTKRVKDLLFINPDFFGGFYLSSIGEGVGAMISTPNETVVMSYVQDHVSDENQLELRNLVSPTTYLRLLNEFAKRQLTKSPQDYNKIEVPWLSMTMKEADAPEQFLAEISCIKIPSTWYNILVRYFPGVSFEVITPGLFKMEYEGRMTFYEGINNLYFMLMVLSTHDNFYVNEGQVTKAIRQAPRIPYFLAYLISHHLLKSEQAFLNNKALLESKVLEEVNLVQGNTHDLRIQTIVKNLDMEKPILDIGCGELLYARKVSKRFKSHYYAFDIEDQIEAKFLKERMALSFTTNLTDFAFVEPVQVIMSEVIEHMTLEDLKKVFDYLKTIPVHSIHITTPNIEFNQFYMIEGLRREDHLRELTLAEFQDLLSGLPFTFEFSGIGDTVNQLQPTLYAKG